MGSITGQNPQPIVHDLYEPSTGTWQYVIADQLTRRCIVIDPTHEHDPAETGVATSAPDNILALIRRHEYAVDWLLETHATGNNRTAVYYLRMQLLEWQGFAPRTCGRSNVSSMKRLFRRKYGDRNVLTTDFDEELRDGDTMHVGNMKVVAMQLGELGHSRLGYVVGHYLFGVHWFTHLTGLEHALNDTELSTLRVRHLWQSMAKVLSFPAQYRVYFDGRSGTAGDGEPFTTIHDCRACNMFAHMSELDFVGYWKALRNPGQLPERPKSRRELPPVKRFTINKS